MTVPGRFAGVLVCSDLDGTLTDGHRLAPRAEEAVRAFQAEGGLFTTATGRHPGHLREFAPAFTANAPLIVLNGTVVYDAARERIIREVPLDFGRAQAVVREIAAFPGLDVLDYCSLDEGDQFSAAAAAALPPDYRVQGRAAPRKIIMRSRTPEDADRLREFLQTRHGAEFDFAKSWEWGLEMSPIGGEKATACRWLKEFLGARLLVTLGNYDNDAGMLAAADRGYAMGDASAPARAATPLHTPPFREGGVAWALANLERFLEGH